MKRLVEQAVSSGLRSARRHRGGLMISVGVCVLSLALYVPLYFVPHPYPLIRFLYNIELKTLDERFQLRGERPPSAPIVIVTIDQKSQDVLGRWPFPRSNFATALDALKKAGARVVAFDATFPQPDENSALKDDRETRKDFDATVGASQGKLAGFAARLKDREAEADNDQKFANALSRFDNAILGYFYLFDSKEAATQDRERVKERVEFVNYLSFQAYPQVIHPEYGRLFNCGYCEAVGLDPNLPKLAENAKNFGFFNVVADTDGVVRREPVIVRYQSNYYPSLDVAAALAYTNISLDQVAVVFNRNGLERIDFGKVAIPTDPDGFVQIDFHGPRETYPWVSLADVVPDNAEVSVTQVGVNEGKPIRVPKKEIFRDKIVLIGPTATGIADTRPTPFDTVFPGVEVHANFIDNLLTGQFIRRGLRENLIDIGFILLFSLAAGVLLSVVRASRATPVVVILLGLFLGLSYYLFASRRIWIAVFLPTATLSINYASIISYRFFFEEREKRKVRATFGQYVAPGVVNLLLNQPELLRLGGEEKELTAMFSDIRGFTALSEGLSPEALVDLLNEYLSEMTETLFRNWGTLDKYIGDAIMAYWGWPYPQADHAERACRAALEMLQVLKKLQERWQAEGRPQINIGVGINTGSMIVGNMGSTNRKNITIMGDEVNLASRLEGTNKEFGTRIIISESTYQATSHMVVARELDLIRVKGKMRPVRIYELLAHADQKEQFRDLLDRFQQGLGFYRGGDWESAARIFEGLVQDYPDDKPSQIFLDRCRDLMVQPPEGAWDGVYVMTHK